MNHFWLNVGLALVWAALTGQFSPANLLFGFGLGYFTLSLARRVLGPSTYFDKLWQAIGFGLFFVWELVLANVRVAADVLTPRAHMQPRVLAIQLEAKTDTEIAIVASLISLTPGTLSLDVSSDRRVLYLHAMYAADAEAVRRSIKAGFERRVLALTRGQEKIGDDA